jgi:hypothetical protein
MPSWSFILRATQHPSLGQRTTFRRSLLPLFRNRLHVVANDVVVAGLPIAEIGSNDKHLAGNADREQSCILDTDIHAKDSVVDRVADVVDNLASYFGVLSAPHAQTFLHEFVQLLPLLGR